MINNPRDIKNFTATGAIAAKRIVALAAGGSVSQASAGTDNVIGVAELASASGSRVDVVTAGIAEVEAGGSISCGDWVTADSNGKAAAAESTDTVIGIAWDDASSGDYFPVRIAPGRAIPAAEEPGTP